MLELRSSSLADTHAIAAVIASLARAGDIIVLSGEMGAGKTAFAQGFGRALGVTEPITSPTFTLVHSYDCDRITLHHADLYRLERTSEVAELALAELAEFDGVVLIEWGEVAETALGEHLVVHLEPDLDDPDALSGDGDATDAGSGDGEQGDEGYGDEVFIDGSRMIELSAVGPGWAGRWERLVAACAEYRC
jgi:tRNA threonylcarbamoyladenosine biosynthesis protein TsaE